MPCKQAFKKVMKEVHERYPELSEPKARSLAGAIFYGKRKK